MQEVSLDRKNRKQKVLAQTGKSETINGIQVPTRRTLVKFLVVAGLRRDIAGNIADMFLKWCHCNGPEWTNARWKELRMWYEQWLGGNQARPSWFRAKHGIPVGPLKHIWTLEPAKALLALSINTMLLATEPTAQQLAKVDKGFSGNGYHYSEESQYRIKQMSEKARPKKRVHPRFDPKLRLLDTTDLEGRATVPVGGRSMPTRVPEKYSHAEHADEHWKALAITAQYQEVPECCLDFLWDSGHLDFLPIRAIGNEYQLDLNHCTKIVGRGFCLQEPQIKARFGVSYNALVQVCLEPLGRFWWKTLERMSFTKEGRPGENQDVANSCYLNQDLGREWVRSKLEDGFTLAGVDLTSATDLLSLDACLDLVNEVWFSDLASDEEYQRHCEFFKRVSRAPFLWIDGGIRQYKQGWPLGTYPSFALLSLTIMAAMRISLIDSNCEPTDHMNLGDDAILDARAAAAFTELLTLLGGEVNHSKTLTSGKAAEFAGRVITAKEIIRKAVKVNNRLEVSDDAFFDLMAVLGSPGKALLQPRQRKVWNKFQYVPGIILGGFWSPDGYGEPLSLRYQWYLEQVERCKLEPDEDRKLDAAERQLRLRYVLGHEPGEVSTTLPELLSDDYQSSFSRPVHGNPTRLRPDRSLLQVLEGWLADGLVDYESWKQESAVSANVSLRNHLRENSPQATTKVPPCGEANAS